MIAIWFGLLEISNIFGQSLSPNSYDSATNAETYNIAPTTSGQSVNCGAANSGTTICIISCTLDNSCPRLNIVASSVQYLELNCLAFEACDDIYISEGPTIQADIKCQSSEGRSCYDASFVLTNTPNVNIRCDNSGYTGFSSSYGSCYNFNLRAANAENVTLECKHRYDCHSANIYLNNITGNAVISATGYYSLSFANIDAPSKGKTGGLKINCSNTACTELEVYPLYKSVYTLSNSSGDYYDVIDTIPNKIFDCASNKGCHIRCRSTASCKSAQVVGSPSWLHLECTHGLACHDIYVAATPSQSATIICRFPSGYSCYGANLNLTNTPIVDITCDISGHTGSSYPGGSCNNVNLRAADADHVTINCLGILDCAHSQIYVNNVATRVIINGDGEFSLYYATIYGSNANQLDIACNNYRSCSDAKIYPPSQGSAYAFKMYCIPIPISCETVDIVIPSSTSQTTNYMELICPLKAGSCSFRFLCQDLGTSSYQTDTEWSSSSLQYECNNQDCCPWTDPKDMIQNTTTNTILPHSITPTTDNGTHQYYDISDEGMTFKQISCTTSEACYISCALDGICQDASIYAGFTKYLQLDCLANEACDDLYITEGPKDRIDINCRGSEGSACYSADFVLTNTNQVNLICSGNGTSNSNCRYIILRAENAEYVTIDCEDDCWFADFYLNNVGHLATINSGHYSSSNVNIYAANANALNVHCNAAGSCYNWSIYPPYTSEYIYKMECSPVQSSCHNVTLYVPSTSSVADNWMELICPSTNSADGVCDIHFICQDQGSLVAATGMTWNDTYSRYECNNQNCCPWTHPNFMIDLQTNAPTPPSNAPSAVATSITGHPSVSPSNQPNLSTMNETTDEANNMLSDAPTESDSNIIDVASKNSKMNYFLHLFIFLLSLYDHLFR